MADVRIKIDIDADTSAIDRVRLKLRQLCNEVDDCTKVHKKHTDQLRELGKEQKRVGDGNDQNGKGFNKLEKLAKGLLGGLKSLAMLGFKYVALEAGAALLVIGSAGILFKTGAFLAKSYQAALSGVAYAMAGIVAVGAAFLAAQREFQAVQFAPAYNDGAINTKNNVVAASGAMKMFVDDTRLAVIGAKGLSSAFKTLSDQAPVTGQTVAVFRSLTDYTAGMGGDLEKGSQAMAKFLAQYQKDKTMTSAVKKAGEELGPQFKTILEEANKMGIKTYEQFSAAAIKGELGATFDKYSGQLARVNSTLIGMFKSSFAEIKSFLVEIGEPLLQPIKEQMPRLMNIIKALLIQIRGNVTEIGTGSLLKGLVDVVDKIASWVGRLAGGDLGKAGTIIDGMRKSWDMLVRGFEKIQDYLRPLQEAASALWEVLKPILGAFLGNFNSSIQMLSDSLVNNKDTWVGFSEAIGKFLRGVGEFGASIKNTFVALMPDLGSLAKTLGNTFKIMGQTLEASEPILKVLLKVLNAILKVFNMLASIIGVTLGKVTGGLSSVLTLLGGFMLLGKGKALMGGKGGVGAKAFDFLFKKNAAGATGASRIGGALKSGGSKAMSFLGKAATNPLTYKLGASAALAYGGYKMVDFTSSKFGDDSIKSRSMSALAGAGSGALAGAGIGAMFGGGPGAVAGAVVGSIIGGVVGFLKAGKAKRDARKAANALVDTYSSAIDDAISSGDIEALTQARDAALQGYNELISQGGYKASEVKKKQDELNNLNKEVDTYIKNAGNFEALSGLDPDKMNEYLKKIYGSEEAAAEAAKTQILNIFDIMRAGGIDVAQQWSSLMDGFNQSILEQRLALFDIPQQMLETQKAVDAAQRKILEGDTTTEAVTDFLKKAYEYSLSQTGGDALAATDHMREMLDKAYGPGGSLESVADLIEGGADKLLLFDANKIVEQMATSGMLQTQGRAIESLTGGKISAGAAELQLRSLVGTSANPADTANLVNRIIEGAITGKLGTQSSMQYLFTKGGLEKGRAALEAYDQELINRDATRQAFGITSGETVPYGNYAPVNVGGVTVYVSGFLDRSSINYLAQEIGNSFTQYTERKGMGTTTKTNVSGGGGFVPAEQLGP